MNGDTRHTYVFRTRDGWVRRVLASNSRNAGIILAEEISAAKFAQYHAYRPGPGFHDESKRLDKFKLTDFISCEIEH